MSGAALQFNENDQIGRVVGVDTSRVAIDVTNSEMLTRIGIGQLIAIKGASQAEFLIAIKLDQPQVKPNSATRDFWKDWGSLMPDKKLLEAAVECLRSQSRAS